MNGWLIAYPVVMLAALSKGVTGFAFALVSAPVLLMVLDPKAVVVVNLLLGTFLSILLIAQSGQHINWRRVISLAVASFLGIPLGTFVLLAVTASTLKVLMGVVVLVSAVPLLLGYSRSFRREGLASGFFGFWSGVLGASTSLSGPPIVLFLVNQRWGKDSLRASLAAFFLLSNLASLFSLTVSGAVRLETLTSAAMLIPACLLGFYLGVWIMPRVNPSVFSRVSVLTVLATGLMAVGMELIRLFS